MHDGGLDLGRWSEGAGRYAERQSDVAIELGERDDAAGAPRELARQRALPRTDLEHEVVSRRRDEIDDAASDGGVAQKMLAESAAPVVHVSHGTTPRRAGIGVAKLLIGEGPPCSKRSWSAPISRRPRTKRGGSPSSWRGASAPSSRSSTSRNRSRRTPSQKARCQTFRGYKKKSGPGPSASSKISPGARAHRA